MERFVLRLAALATMVIGLILLVFSSELVRLFEKGTGTSRHFAIYLGAALLGFAVINWLYSRSHDLAAILPAIYGNMASLLIATIIDIVSLLLSSANKAIWPILFLHLVFLGAFSYCLLDIRRSQRV